jgi:hypothetical protein
MSRRDASRYPGAPYQRGARGWMVAHTAAASSGRVITAWWYGPDHGWGKTYGGLASPGPVVWPTKFSAEMALRSIYGTPANWQGQVVIRVADAELVHTAQTGGGSC